MTAAQRRPEPRLCMVTEAFAPDAEGGQVTQARELAERLVDRGIAVTVLTRLHRRGDPRRIMVGRIPVVRVAVGGVLRGAGAAAAVPLARFLLTTAGWLVRHRAELDVVMALGIKVLPAAVVPAGWIAGRPVILKPESTIEFDQPMAVESIAKLGRLGRLAAVAVENARDPLLRAATRVVAMAPSIEGHLRRRGIRPERVAAIANGVALDRFAPATADDKARLRQALGLPAATPVLIFTGRLATSKGLLVLARAWVRAAALFPEAVLVLLGGDGGTHDPCAHELRRIIEGSGLTSRTLLPGNVERPEDWLRAADLFVFPSFYEGFGLSLIEAMACALPVITTPVGVANEVVTAGVNGCLVPIDDDVALAEALIGLLAAPQRWPAWGEAAAAAVAGFGFDRVADAYADLLRDLLRPAPGRGRPSAAGPLRAAR